MSLTDYIKGRETFQILVKDIETRVIVDEWVHRRLESDLRLRKAKTKGHRVIETTDVMFANHIRIHFPGSKINIKTHKP